MVIACTMLALWHLLAGSESMAIYLHCLTSIEMYTNARYYCTHPLIEQQHKKGAFENMSNTFAMYLLMQHSVVLRSRTLISHHSRGHRPGS